MAMLVKHPFQKIFIGFKQKQWSLHKFSIQTGAMYTCLYQKNNKCY